MLPSKSKALYRKYVWIVHNDRIWDLLHHMPSTALAQWSKITTSSKHIHWIPNTKHRQVKENWSSSFRFLALPNSKPTSYAFDKNTSDGLILQIPSSSRAQAYGMRHEPKAWPIPIYWWSLKNTSSSSLSRCQARAEPRPSLRLDPLLMNTFLKLSVWFFSFSGGTGMPAPLHLGNVRILVMVGRCWLNILHLESKAKKNYIILLLTQYY